MKMSRVLFIAMMPFVFAVFPGDSSGQETGCTFCLPCQNPDQVMARTHEISMIAIDHPPFACSESEGCEEEPPCNPTNEDLEEQIELLSLLQSNDLGAIKALGAELAGKLETVPERSLVLFRTGRCGNPVIGIYPATEEQILALRPPPQ